MQVDLQLIKRCARFSQLAYQDNVAIEGMVVEVFGCKETDTQGFIAYNDSEIFVVFRGTESIRDWLTDADCRLNALGIHLGFAEAFSSVNRTLVHLLAPHCNSGKRFIFTGHSLGGALAMVAAYWLNEPGILNEVVTFGQPRVGNASFRYHYDIGQLLQSSTIRVIHDTDIVPRLPFLLWLLGKYKHAGGTEVFIDTCGCLRINPPFWWKLLSDSLSLYHDFKQRRLGVLTDHKMSHYIEALDALRGDSTALGNNTPTVTQPASPDAPSAQSFQGDN